MMYLLIVSLLIYAAYVDQVTYINYLLALCLVAGVVSIIITTIISFFIKLEVNIDKDVCYEYEGQKITFKSNAFLSPKIKVNVKLYNKQLKSSQGRFSVSVKTDGGSYTLPTFNCGDDEIIIKSYTIKGFFGLFGIRKKFKRNIGFKVYPKNSKYNKEDIKELLLNGDGEPINKKGGDYQELYEIRPIQPGDNIRYVHPSLSAKFNEYMIKVGSETQRKLIMYELKEYKDFFDIIADLRKISAIYKDLSKDPSKYFCVKFKYNWFIILNTRSLLGLFDLVYKEYLK